MDAILGNIFLAIQQQLAAELPELKFIDLDTGQLEYKKEGDRPAVLLPCALIDFIHVEYEEYSELRQIGKGALRIRLGVDPFTQATHYFSAPQIANALNFFNIEHRVNQKLHGWSNSEYFTPLARTSMRSEVRQDKLRVRALDYTFSFNDDTAMAVTTTIATPDLALDIDTPIDGV